MRGVGWVVLLGVFILGGCDDTERGRDPELPEIDAQMDTGAVDEGLFDADVVDTDVLDADVVDADVVDAARDTEVDAELDAAPDAEPDAAPPEEICNGLDDDDDGLVDEGVANICGGCGAIPPEGCQAWRIDLLQDAEGLLNPDRVVKLMGAAVEATHLRIEGADCELVLIPGQAADAHLGQVNVESPRVALNIGPVYDPEYGGVRYLNSPAIGAVHLHEGGDLIEIRAGGGALVGGFLMQVEAPAAPAGITGQDLQPLVDAALGAEGPVELSWQPGGGGTLSLFVGGSASLFRPIADYRGTWHYQLDGRLLDDGALSLPAGFFGGGRSDSSVWTHLTRAQTWQRQAGPHLVEVVAGGRVEHRGAGPSGAESRPFQIEAPSPNDRTIVPGAPLTVRWSPLPEGEGPLTVVLTLLGEGVRTQAICQVDDPEVGEIVLPAAFTEAWPAGEDDLRQISLRWDVYHADLPAPDQGQLSAAITVQLNLDP